MSKKKKKTQAKRKKTEIYQPSLFEKRRGGQPGNQNAVKHGLYSPRFSPDEVESLTGMREGLVEEIDLMRVQIARLLDYSQELKLKEDVPIQDMVAVMNLYAKNAATVARLMQVNKALQDAQNTSVGEQLLAALRTVSDDILGDYGE